MALSKAVLRDLIDTKYAALNTEYAGSPERDTIKDGLLDAIADAVIEHITTAGQVTVTVTSVSGVTVGAGVSGPGSGTGTIS